MSPEKEDMNRVKGFTILELLVASAVSIILLGLFLMVSANILDVWGQSRDNLSSNAKARIILETLSRDLESAIIRNSSDVWLACDLLEDTRKSGNWEIGVKEKPTGAESVKIDFEDPDSRTSDFRFGVAGSWLRFFGSPVDASDTKSAGDINAIAYQIIRRKPHSLSSELDEGYNLYRSVVSSYETNEEIKEDGGYFIDQFEGESYEGHAGEIISPNARSSLLARDIVDLGFVFYQKDSSGQNKILFPIQGGKKIFRVPADGIPTSAQVFARILDEEGVKQISAYERGLVPTIDPDFWWNTVTQFSTVYTKRVQFKASGL